MKHILIVDGGPRRNMNTTALCDALAALVEDWLRDRGLATRQPQTRALTAH